MTKSILFFLALALTTSFGNADDKAASPAGGMNPEMMKAMKEYATPGEPHKVLAMMAGTWKYTSKFWMTADSKPEESSGSSVMKMILGNRFLEHTTKGKAMGQNFEGLGITGYDNLKGKYDTIWLDNMGTGVMHGSGTFDQTTKTLSDSGSYSCPMSPTKSKDYRSEWKMVDRNNMIYTMFGPGEDGKEFKQMEMTFKRK